jgi:AGZA family xanthine/uracil permease-like MFS transporter
VAGATEQLLTTTALAAATGTLVMGLLARYPFALAPGMGINAYFTYTVCLGQGYAWQTALGAVFLSGILFVILSLVGIRELIIDGVPSSIKAATGAGIGLFLAFIGLQAGGLVVSHPVTLVTLGDLKGPPVILTVSGLIVTACLLALRVRGALLIGIGGITALAILTGAKVYQGQAFAGFKGGVLQAPVWPKDLFLAMDLGAAFELGVLGIVFVFFFVDLFDTAGTLFGLAQQAGYTNAAGALPRAKRAFLADALATVTGAIFGTSSTTTYVESAAGIEDGGRTGLTAVVTAICFLLAIFISPLAGAVPGVATAPALIIIGAMMTQSINGLNWSDYRIGVPAFLTMVAMPLTYSIANGISLGIISYTLLHVFTGKWRDVSWLLLVLTGLLIARYAYLAAG